MTRTGRQIRDVGHVPSRTSTFVSVPDDPPPDPRRKLGDTDGDGKRDFLILDDFSERLSALRSLSKSNDEAGVDAIMSNFGAKGRVEKDIFRELSARKPL